jgi:RND family efflux transporter MFP subunit
LEKTKVYAPTDGIVTQIYAYPGELVSSGSALAEVFSKAVVVEAKVNEEDFAGIQAGLDVTVRLLTYGNKLFQGTIDRVLPTADKETQQYTVLLRVEIDPKLLLPGLSGEASIIRRKIPNALILPRRALVGDYVFKVENGKAIFTAVKVGVRGLHNVEIKEGLAAGDLVVTDGMTSLKDGDAIRMAD